MQFMSRVIKMTQSGPLYSVLNEKHVGFQTGPPGLKHRRETLSLGKLGLPSAESTAAADPGP